MNANPSSSPRRKTHQASQEVNAVRICLLWQDFGARSWVRPFIRGMWRSSLPLQGVSQSIALMRAHVCYLFAIRWRRRYMLRRLLTIRIVRYLCIIEFLRCPLLLSPTTSPGLLRTHHSNLVSTYSRLAAWVSASPHNLLRVSSPEHLVHHTNKTRCSVNHSSISASILLYLCH